MSALSREAPARAEDLPLILTPAQAAVLLQVGRKTVYELIRQRRIPYVQVGTHYRIPRDGLLRAMGQPEPPAPVIVRRPRYKLVKVDDGEDIAS